MKLLCILLLTAALLAGCAVRESQPDQSPPLPVQSSAVPEPAADRPVIVLVDAPGSPYPMAVGNWTVDMDGDGSDELVELRAEKLYEPIEPMSSTWEEDTASPLRPYTLVVTREDTVYEHPISRNSNEQPITEGIGFFPPGEHRTELSWTQDRTGNPVLVLWTDSMGNGGMGGIYVYAFAFQDGIVPLPVPQYGLETVLDEETMLARVTVPETGCTETLDLMEWLEKYKNDNTLTAGYDEPQYENGVLIWPTEPKDIDSTYFAGFTVEGLVLRQYIFGSSHSEGMGDLVTTVTWEDGEAVVLEQHFEWYPDFWEFYWNTF